MNKLAMRTPDLASANVEKIAGLFPHCVTEAHDADGALRRMIDWDLLRQELSSDLIQGAEERYRLDWPGKRQALYTGNMPINKTLRPCRSDSVDFDRSENLFIEGDNLDVLKLLQHTYMGKVKMIYIDPPYNTGKDFIYRDNYAASKAEYLHRSSQVDDAGNRLVANNESNGRFHSDWLSMMYPRLRLAQKLLRDDGVIFISIDDNEQASLKRLCDEVFGEANFVALFPWRSRTAKADVPYGVSKDNEWIIAYANPDFIAGRVGVRKYYESSDIKDRWRLQDLTKNTTKDERPNSYFVMINPKTGDKFYPNENRTWSVTADTFQKYYESGKIVFPGDYDFLNIKRPAFRVFESEDINKAMTKYGVRSTRMSVSTCLPEKDVGRTEHGSKEIRELLDSQLFSYPKPSSLIQYLVSASCSDKDIILDFFSGSATTAHAVMQLNAEDGGNRKFIMVQLPEACDPKSEAYKAGYKTIADIGRERIRRAGAKILAGDCHEGWNKDVGFRSLLVDSSNMNNAYYSPAETQQGQLDLWAREYIKSGRSGEDLLFQVLLDWGLGLTLPIERQQICGLEVFIVDDNQLVACFAQAGEIDDELFYHLAKLRPRRALFRSSGLTVDSTQTNAEQIFGLISPSTEIKIL